MFKKFLGGLVSAVVDIATSNSETSNSETSDSETPDITEITNTENEQETITKMLKVADGYNSKIYLIQKYPKFCVIDFVLPKGNGTVTIGVNTFNIKHSLNNTTVEMTGISANANKKKLVLTYDKDEADYEKNLKIAESICSYVHMYTEYGGML